jgi:branched-chain amino acid transport system permease protein
VFVVQLTVYIFLAVTLGGYTRLSGAVVGSIALVALLESTRFAASVVPGLDAVQVASLREISIAVALIIVMQLRPEGMFRLSNEQAGAPQPSPK